MLIKKALPIVTVALVLLLPAASPAAVEITPWLSTGAEFTDNVRLVPDGKDPDIITRITPGISMDVLGKTANATLSYEPSFVSYVDKTYEDYWQHKASGTGWWKPAKHTLLQLSDNYLRSEDPIVADDLTVRRSRNPYTRNTATARLRQGYGAESNFYLTGRYSILRNEDPEIEDKDYAGGTAGLSHWFGKQWGLDLEARYFEADYKEPEIFTGVLSDDYTEKVGRARLSHRFTTHFTGYLEYEHTFHDYLDDSVDDFKIYDGSVGFIHNINRTLDLEMSLHYFVRDFEESEDQANTPLNFTLTKRLQHGILEAEGAGGYNYTSTTAENLGYYTYYRGGVTGEYDFTTRLSGNVGAFYEYRDYKDVPGGRKDDIARATCELSFQLLRWLSAQGGYRLRLVDSTVDNADYVENRLFLYLTIMPERPWRF